MANKTNPKKTFEKWWENITYKQLSEMLTYIPITEMYDENGNSALHYIAKSDNEFITQKLIEAGCKLDHKNHNGETALIIALINRNSKIANILITAGATCTGSYFKNSRTLLHIAAKNGCTDTVQMLIKSGADVNAVDSVGRTPLHEAMLMFGGMTSEDKSEIVELLIQAKSNVNAKDFQGSSPLHHAINNNFTKAFEMLVDAGADIHAKDFENQSLLHVAVECDNINFAKKLIELGIDVNSMDCEHHTCVHLAVNQGCVEMLHLLLESGASPNIHHPSSYDPLCYNLRRLRSMHLTFRSPFNDDGPYDHYIESQSTVNTMHYAACVELLLDYGADVNRINRDKITPIYLVLQNMNLHTQYLRLLLAYGAKFDFDHPELRDLMMHPNPNYNGKSYKLILIRHQAMYDAQGRKDGPQNFNLRILGHSWEKFYGLCRDEIELMRSTPFGETRITPFNILVDKKIEPYARIENIESLFELLNVTEKFPIYSDLLIERFQKALHRELLVSGATEGLCHIFSLNENAHAVIVDRILSYLGEKELSTLGDI